MSKKFENQNVTRIEISELLEGKKNPSKNAT